MGHLIIHLRVSNPEERRGLLPQWLLREQEAGEQHLIHMSFNIELATQKQGKEKGEEPILYGMHISVSLCRQGRCSTSKEWSGSHFYTQLLY